MKIKSENENRNKIKLKYNNKNRNKIKSNMKENEIKRKMKRKATVQRKYDFCFTSRENSKEADEVLTKIYDSCQKYMILSQLQRSKFLEPAAVLVFIISNATTV